MKIVQSKLILVLLVFLTQSMSVFGAPPPPPPTGAPPPPGLPIDSGLVYLGLVSIFFVAFKLYYIKKATK